VNSGSYRFFVYFKWKKFFYLIETIGTSNNYFQKCSNASFPPPPQKKHLFETSSSTFVQDNTVWMRNGCLGKIDSSVGDAWTKCQVHTTVQLGTQGLNVRGYYSWGSEDICGVRYTILKLWVHVPSASYNTTVGDTKTAKCQIYCRSADVGARQSARYTAVIGPWCHLYWPSDRYTLLQLGTRCLSIRYALLQLGYRCLSVRYTVLQLGHDV